jgi:hypothetical protein
LDQATQSTTALPAMSESPDAKKGSIKIAGAPPEESMCEAVTKRGKNRCRRWRQAGTRFCGDHQPSAQAAPVKPEPQAADPLQERQKEQLVDPLAEQPHVGPVEAMDELDWSMMQLRATVKGIYRRQEELHGKVDELLMHMRKKARNEEELPTMSPEVVAQYKAEA